MIAFSVLADGDHRFEYRMHFFDQFCWSWVALLNSFSINCNKSNIFGNAVEKAPWLISLYPPFYTEKLSFPFHCLLQDTTRHYAWLGKVGSKNCCPFLSIWPITEPVFNTWLSSHVHFSGSIWILHCQIRWFRLFELSHPPEFVHSQWIWMCYFRRKMLNRNPYGYWAVWQTPMMEQF